MKWRILLTINTSGKVSGQVLRRVVARALREQTQVVVDGVDVVDVDPVRETRNKPDRETGKNQGFLDHLHEGDIDSFNGSNAGDSL